MNYDFYLEKFKRSAKSLDKKLFTKKQLEVSTGIILKSVFLKIYKKEWTNDKKDPLNAETRIFFSIWVSDKAIKEEKIFYNIHALKLRKLKGYSISSRTFADNFRKKFKSHTHKWENVSVNFGPLTLMEGWIKSHPAGFENAIISLANNFLEIDHLIDETLTIFRKKFKD